MPIGKFLKNKTNNKKCRLNGIIPSKRLPMKASLHQKFANHIRFGYEQLPPKVDLRFDMTPIEDQSSIGSCVANAFAGVCEYLLKKTSGDNIDVSRLFIYYNARLKDEESADDIEDSGCTVTSAIESLEESGTCLESIWPYYVKRVNKCPSGEAYEAAGNNAISGALQLNVDLYEMKACLAQGFPFVFGLDLFKSVDKATDRKGAVPMPKPSEVARESHGGHSMAAVGYSDKSKAFIVRNSWGTEWGDKGYCYIPYEYMTNTKLCSEPCTVRKVEIDDMGHEHWDEEDDTDYGDDSDDDDDDDDDDDLEIEDEEIDDDDDEDDE